MSLVVSDASPIHYLILINATHILPRLFSKVILPEYVLVHELQQLRTPPEVRNWVDNLPSWVELRTPTRQPEAMNLDPGEEQAITLALELGVPVLLDEKEARVVATRKGILVIGTIGLVERAAVLDLVDLTESLNALQKTNMRIHHLLIEAALKRHAQKKPSSGTD